MYKRQNLAADTVLVHAGDFTLHAHLHLAPHSTESYITAATLPPDAELVPRAPPPNLPVFALGLGPDDFKLVGARGCTYSHYVVVDLEVTVRGSTGSTHLNSVPLRVLSSACPCVVLGTNDFRD